MSDGVDVYIGSWVLLFIHKTPIHTNAFLLQKNKNKK